MSEQVRYGGQAVIEGVMMRGRKYFAVACRRSCGEIIVQKEPIPTYLQGQGWQRWPLVRGVVALVDSMVLGMKTLLYSADIAMADVEEEEKKKKTPPPGIAGILSLPVLAMLSASTDGEKPSRGTIASIALPFSMILGLGLAILLFKFVPLFVTQLLSKQFHIGGSASNIIDGLLRMSIFIGYILAVSRLKDIKRVFQYHGAEHKTIHAFEAKAPLVPEEVQKFTTRHQRCGTTFILLVLVIQMLLVLLTKWEWSFLMKFGVRLALLVPVAAISFEIIRMAGKYKDSSFWNMVVAPGMWLQGLTTREPDNQQVEVAIAALNGVMEQEKSAESEDSRTENER